ncbi:MAG: hypothetical protein WCF92_00910 [bacterium]
MSKLIPPTGVKKRWNALYSALKPEQKTTFDNFIQIRNKIGKGEFRVLGWLMFKPSTAKNKALEKYLADTDQNTIKNAQCGGGSFMRLLFSLEDKAAREEFFREADKQPLNRGVYHPDQRVDHPIHRKIGHT